MTFSDVYELGYFNCFCADALANSVFLQVMLYVGSAIIGYLLGSINTSLVLSKIYGKDVREEGSHNAGTTNVMRVFGKKAGIITFIGDFLKSSLALFLGRMVFGWQGAYIAGILCIIGHAYPLYFRFKGGKGVVCVAALGLFTTPIVFLVMLLIFVVILFGFKMVSFASVMTMIVFPFVLSNMIGPGPWVLYATVAALLVIFLHRENIKRIFNHQERKISFGKKKKKDDSDEESDK